MLARDDRDSEFFIRRIIDHDPGEWVPVFEAHEQPGVEMFRFACLLTEEAAADAAHRKGSDFNEALLLDGAPDLPALFETLLSSLARSFEQLCDDLAASSAP